MDQSRSSDFHALSARLTAHLDHARQLHGLAAALEGLRRHQVKSGFIQDDLSEVRRFEFPRPGQSGDYFAAQYNPARARRFSGRGVHAPPVGRQSVNEGCFLCAENIEWQQQGLETGYPLGIGRVDYTAWMNPFPLAVGHAIIASRDHLHQHWSRNGLGLAAMIGDMLQLASALPGWITFYNGVGAGASIEGHLHYHALPRTPGLKPMPIEQAAARHREGAVARGLYPLDFAHWRETPGDLREKLRPWLDAWLARTSQDPDITANAMAAHDATSGLIDFYFVPRVMSRSRAEGLGGVIGAFEVMGEIICSQPGEKDRIENGEVDYFTIENMLRHVSVAL